MIASRSALAGEPDRAHHRGMHVFLTGGSGYLGRRTLPALLAAGHTVSALARSVASARTVAGLGATPVRGDLTDVAVLRAGAATADGVIHLGSSGEDTAAVDRAAAAALQAGVGAGPYVHTGGTWVYGSAQTPVDESAPYRAPAITAWREGVEREVLDRAREGGRPVLVLPGLVYGAGEGIPQQALVEAGRADGVVRCVGEGRNRWGLVHVEDIAALYVLALEAQPGARFNGVAEAVAQRDVADALAQAPGNPHEVRPWTLTEAGAALGPGLAEALALDQQVLSGRARAALGWAPRHTDALADLRAGR
jgi:nucleoside-diphosphate-sugar epimerase